ncbi:MAG TPA: hypothetical protein VFV70_02265, partial [Hyphomonadaceae bacterium]|nr:hypothetical protein [Hyphomonadaceae bacterium]
MRGLMIVAIGAALTGIASPALAQAPDAYRPPHTSWGAPDLQGYWTNASITKLTRPAGIATLILSQEQADRIEKNDFNNRRLEADQKPTDQALGAPVAGGLQANGNYNAFWWDPGSRIATINGEYRSSWIVDP